MIIIWLYIPHIQLSHQRSSNILTILPLLTSNWWVPQCQKHPRKRTNRRPRKFRRQGQFRGILMLYIYIWLSYIHLLVDQPKPTTNVWSATRISANQQPTGTGSTPCHGRVPDAMISAMHPRDGDSRRADRDWPRGWWDVAPWKWVFSLGIYVLK